MKKVGKWKGYSKEGRKKDKEVRLVRIQWKSWKGYGEKVVKDTWRLSLCRKLKFSNPYIFAICWGRPVVNALLQ